MPALNRLSRKTKEPLDLRGSFGPTVKYQAAVGPRRRNFHPAKPTNPNTIDRIDEGSGTTPATLMVTKSVLGSCVMVKSVRGEFAVLLYSIALELMNPSACAMVADALLR